jgi:hypothetical protein
MRSEHPILPDMFNMYTVANANASESTGNPLANQQTIQQKSYMG